MALCGTRVVRQPFRQRDRRALLLAEEGVARGLGKSSEAILSVFRSVFSGSSTQFPYGRKHHCRPFQRLENSGWWDLPVYFSPHISIPHLPWPSSRVWVWSCSMFSFHLGIGDTASLLGFPAFCVCPWFLFRPGSGSVARLSSVLARSPGCFLGISPAV